MGKLLDEVLAAHGGPANWSRVSHVSADMSIKGATWVRKGWPDALADVVVEADTRRPWVSYTRFARPDWISEWTPDRVVVRTTDGSVLAERDDPRASFAGHELTTPWDVLHLAYFSGYAIWNYLNTPFMFTLPDVETEELDEVEEDGERRRRLKLTFPDRFATHCREQIFYVDDAGLVRRLDYAADVVGGARTAHYLSDYRVVEGFAFPTRRRAMRRDADDRPITDVVVVGIDMTGIRLT